jgi:ComF family protein
MCAACWQGVPILLGPLCKCCSEPVVVDGLEMLAQPLVAGGSEPTPAPLLCPRCRQQRPLVSIAAAAGRYDGALRTAIHGLKYDQRRSLARPLARLMTACGAGVLSGADAVVPVPLHPSRRRQRGFNQAADLARRLGLPMIHALRRVRATAPQADLSADARLANVAAAYDVARSPERWRDATLVLVDDVATTGATLDACAEVLLLAGAKEVRALTAARAVKSRP